MNSRPHRISAAFTLVELLTVITIIAILMGLLFPAISIAKDQARKAQARTDVMQIAAAVKQYYAEYSKYPLGVYQQAGGGSGTPADVLVGGIATTTPTTTNQLVFDVLRHTGACTSGAQDYNPRGIIFFEGKGVPDPTAPKGGFVPNPSSGAKVAQGYIAGAYVDPWGTEYGIAIDGNYDNQISTTGVLPYTDFQGASGPMVGVAVFSLGKDRAVGNKGDGYYKNPTSTSPSDDIVSWQ